MKDILEYFNAPSIDGSITRVKIDFFASSMMMSLEELFSSVRKIGEEIGLDLKEASVAGGSDGNFCSYYCPVIDGLGAVGGGAHSDNEYILVNKIPERTALLYLILKNIARPGGNL